MLKQDLTVKKTKPRPVPTEIELAVARFLRFLEVERNTSDYTIKSYREDLEALLEYLYELYDKRVPQPQEITTLDLRGYMSAMHDAEYSKATIARRLASLRTFFKFGLREGWATLNPAKPLRNPRVGRQLPFFLSTAELGALLSAPPNDVPGLRDRAILETMYSSGIRVSEAVGLNMEDYDDEEGLIRVRGKGKKERFSPIGSFAKEALANWLAVRSNLVKKNELLIADKHHNDRLHIGCAFVTGCDIIVSMNFKHLVNVKIIRGVRAISNIEGYKNIDIIQPAALVEEEGAD